MTEELKQFYSEVNKNLLTDMMNGNKIRCNLNPNGKVLIYQAYSGYIIPAKSLYLSTGKMFIDIDVLEDFAEQDNHEIRPTGVYKKEGSVTIVEFESVGEKRFNLYLNSIYFEPFEKCDKFISSGEMGRVYAYIGNEMVGLICPLNIYKNQQTGRYKNATRY